MDLKHLHQAIEELKQAEELYKGHQKYQDILRGVLGTLIDLETDVISDNDEI